MALAQKRSLLSIVPDTKEETDKLVYTLSKLEDKVSSTAAVLYAYGIVDRQGNLVENNHE